LEKSFALNSIFNWINFSCCNFSCLDNTCIKCCRWL